MVPPSSPETRAQTRAVDSAKIANETDRFSLSLSVTGSLQIWYHLQTDQSPDVFSPALNNLADGRLHRIRIHRVGRNLYVQVSDPVSGEEKVWTIKPKDDVVRM